MTQHLLLPHQASFQNEVQPTAQEVLRWVIQDPTGHWFWKPSREGPDRRRFASNGQPIWSWRPNTRPYRQRGIFVVARVLLQRLRGPFPPQVSFFSGCGLVQCVNPFHWNFVPRPAVFALLESADGWRLHRQRTGHPIVRPQLVRVRVRGAVHVAQLPSDFFLTVTTLCGQQVYPADVVVMPTGSLVTCRGGC